MILWRVKHIEDRPKPIDRLVMWIVGRAAQKRVEIICEPMFTTFNHLEKAYASLNYSAVDRRLVVVRTNMGLCLRPANETYHTGAVL